MCQRFAREAFGEEAADAGAVVFVLSAELAAQELLFVRDDKEVVEHPEGDAENGGGPWPGDPAPAQADQAVADVQRVAHQGVGAPCGQLFGLDLLAAVALDAAGAPEAQQLPEHDENDASRDAAGNGMRQRQDDDEQRGPNAAAVFEGLCAQRGKGVFIHCFFLLRSLRPAGR